MFCADPVGSPATSNSATRRAASHAWTPRQVLEPQRGQAPSAPLPRRSSCLGDLGARPRRAMALGGELHQAWARSVAIRAQSCRLPPEPTVHHRGLHPRPRQSGASANPSCSPTSPPRRRGALSARSRPNAQIPRGRLSGALAMRPMGLMRAHPPPQVTHAGYRTRPGYGGIRRTSAPRRPRITTRRSSLPSRGSETVRFQHPQLLWQLNDRALPNT